MNIKVQFLPKDLKEIGIIKKDGTPIVKFSSLDNLEPTMLEKFISAISSFSEDLQGGTLKSLKLGKNKFFFEYLSDLELIIFCMTDESIKEKKVQKTCQAIAEILKNYVNVKEKGPEIIDNLNFNGLKEKLTIYFKMSNL
ncbi:MAG: hypothetical protein ACTSRH_07575 [Promethearchaeota archaeon]